VEALNGWWDDFFWGSVVVADVFVVALILTVLFGLTGAAAKLSKNRVAQSIANGYTIIFRGTPEILVLLLFYFGSAIALTAIAQISNPEIKYVDIPPFWAGSIAIALIVVAVVVVVKNEKPAPVTVETPPNVTIEAPSNKMKTKPTPIGNYQN